MERTTRGWTLGELADLLGGAVHGPRDLKISRPVPAGSSDVEGITFAESPEYVAKVLNTPVGAVILPNGSPECGVPAIHVDRPREAFGRLLALFSRPLPLELGIHSTAVVSPDADIDPSARVGAYAVVERFAKIGPESRVFPFAYIGESCALGTQVTVHPHAVLYRDVRLGDRTVVHAGAILGADGFGFVWDSPNRNRRVRVPQVGGVIVGSDVEVGALTAIDCATAGDTVVRDGVKIDNLVQIGHNCDIGEHTVIAGQVAVGGSSTIGKRIDIGGKAAISDHVTVGDDVIVAGMTGVANNLPGPGVYWGIPARPLALVKRIYAAMARLPEMNKRLKELERRLAELEREKQ